MSYVDIIKSELEKAQTTVLQVSQITRDRYADLMFTHGSLFAEHFCRHFLNKDDMASALTEDPKYGFWNWWRFQYSKDDILLINNNCLEVISPRSYSGAEGTSYQQLKECMVGDELLESDLYHFLAPWLREEQ